MQADDVIGLLFMGAFIGFFAMMIICTPDCVVKPGCSECKEWVAKVKAARAELKKLTRRV